MNPTRTPRRAATAAALFLGVFTLASMGPAVEARSGRGRREVPAKPAKAGKPDKDAAKRIRAAYAGMPLRFETAAGADADFIARGAGYSLNLGRGEARLLLAGAVDAPRTALTMRLVGGSRAAEGRGRRMLPGLTNYLAGNNPREWRRGVRSFAEVEYRGVYPGVDVVYYGNQRQLEFD